MTIERASDNPFPSVLMVEGDPEALAANPASGQRRLAVGTDHLLYLVDDAGVKTAVGSGAADLDTIIAASSGQDVADALAGAAAPDAGNVFATMADVGGGGGSLSTVTASVTTDRNSNNSSAWTDITDLTGLSVVAGVWIVTLDVEHDCGAIYGPVFRVWDGTTTYAQGGYIEPSHVATVSNHTCIVSQPFTLGSTATMAAQYFSDTVFAVKRYPTRGGISAAPATHVTFLKIG